MARARVSHRMALIFFSLKIVLLISQVFTGNTDSKSTAKQVLHVPVKASYIRVIPLEFKEWPCLRVEIYGKGM